ncbi:uncharacterized protein G2W53_043155 [Senna tora]|uniref:Uncharacterized protein n=1 Tax=Senna tora TaxID=362788 RepID=A0A834SV40_9FABA|nr:uncharacterized protein G2W53_043155 [Senna tora]
MAGLQQYNFFPTDLLYPRHPQPSSNPIVLPLQTPKPETTLHNQSTTFVKAPPSSSALVSTQKQKSQVSSTNPLSWLILVDQEDASDAF